jgi:protein-S-isoprenylcysteine O-methyltransferase Ste14
MSRLVAVFSWIGGGLFVGSLLVAAYALVVTWAEPVPLRGGWFRSLSINAMLVTVFALHHSLFARDDVKTAMTRWMPERLLRPVYVWIASLLLIAVVWLWQPVGGQLYRVEGPLAWILRAGQAAGVVLIAGAVRAIDGLELAGIRAPRRDGSLIATGPYGLVRHPLYLGWMLIVFGAAPMTGDRLAFAIMTTAYLLVAMPWEERSLTRIHGEAYSRYRQQVRWRVLPYVY